MALLAAATEVVVAAPVEQARDYPVFRTTAESETLSDLVYISKSLTIRFFFFFEKGKKTKEYKELTKIVLIESEKEEYPVFRSTVEAEKEEYPVFRSTVEAQKEEYPVFRSTVEAEKEEYPVFRTTVEAEKEEYPVFRSTVEAEKEEYPVFRTAVTPEKEEYPVFRTTVNSENHNGGTVYIGKSCSAVEKRRDTDQETLFINQSMTKSPNIPSSDRRWNLRDPANARVPHLRLVGCV